MIRSYLRIFSWVALFYFVGTLAVNLNTMQDLKTILEGLAGAAVFGAAAAAVLGTVNARRVRALAGPGPQPAGIYDQAQTRRIKLSLTPDRAFHMVAHYFREVARLEVLGADQVARRLDARTPFRPIGGPGCKVSAEVAADGDGAEVTVTSRPAALVALADFGTNLAVVMSLENYLKAADRH